MPETNEEQNGHVAAQHTVSVIVPTYHRPALLDRAVRSVLEQRLPENVDLEVVIAVSDAGSEADRAVADNLAADDHRVRVVIADRKGPGVARNAGMAEAKGDFLALLDDDCIAQPGWLEAGVGRLAEVDLVQGRTESCREPTHPFDRSIWVRSFSGLWESCNLFFRRSVYDTFGGFDEGWNPTGKQGQHWGEDTEWGWRVVRQGTTYAFDRDAYAQHEVFRQSFREWLRYEMKVQYFPLAVEQIPELRETYLFNRYFLKKRHRTLTAALVLLVCALVARVLGLRTIAFGLVALAGIPLASAHARDAYYGVLKEWIHFGALVYGSIRHRRLVL